MDVLLHPGDHIENKVLERAMLILDDQPGLKVAPSISPGEAVGTGDLTVDVARQSYIGGQVGFDNIGNRFTGEYRARATLYANSPFMYGDRITLNNVITNYHLWLGSIDYEMPIGYSGLRAGVGYSKNTYSLGAQFMSLNATGYANVATAKVSYPVIRSQATNLMVTGSIQHKDLHDQFATTGLIKDKRSDALPIGIQFDHRDRFAGGGIT